MSATSVEQVNSRLAGTLAVVHSLPAGDEESVAIKAAMLTELEEYRRQLADLSIRPGADAAGLANAIAKYLDEVDALCDEVIHE